jgi:hypothetical protein
MSVIAALWLYLPNRGSHDPHHHHTVINLIGDFTMDTGKAIFFGLALIALAIFAKDVMRPANAGLMGGGKFMGVANSQSGAAVWIVNTETGAARVCVNQSPGNGEDCDKWIK